MNLGELITNFGIIPAILIGLGYAGYQWVNRILDENKERELRQEQQYKELLQESYKREDKYQDIIKNELGEVRKDLANVLKIKGGLKNE